MMTGCMDYKIVDPNGGEPGEFVTPIGAGGSDGSSSTDRENDSGSGNSGSGTNNGSGNGSGNNDGSSSGNNSGSNGSSGSSNARAPKAGELVIHEIMIDPQAVPDAVGEWVEIYNDSGFTLDLTGHRLADDNKDDTVIQASYSKSLVVEPGEYLVICAEDDYFDNGGADCHGTFHYETWGGGFALSNTGDEVILLAPNGKELDVFAYGTNFAVPGVAMGLAEEWIGTSGNDRESHWCEQVKMMKSGDEGTPDRYNNMCL
jgi:hypothetical protein